MGEIKSAWEIAQEKIKALGELTPEEKREMKEKEYAPKGRVIAEKFLEGVIDQRYLEIELQKLKDKEGREIIERAILEKFIEAIKIEDFSKSQRALEGISSLGKDIADLKDKLSLLYQDYRTKIEKALKGREEQLKVSGSALGQINIEGSELWPEINLEFNLKLNQLKEEIK